ncbi:MAG: hypothetical protein JST39_19445 [Bacteroidetes bacterium]|nr:hypothetical protein [Bacteroidota bacterium]
MFSSLFIAGALFASLHLPVQSDTLPKEKPPVFANEGEHQAYELKQLFRDRYKPQSYPLFDRVITRTASGTYQLGSFTMLVDTVPEGVTGLLSRGLIYPYLVGPLFSPNDTLSIGNIVELKHMSSSPQKRRFSCLVFNSRMGNPILYAFELTNEQGRVDMDLSGFIQGARLTFLYQVNILI